MDNVGKAERATQNRVIALFRDELSYRYLGDWTDREGNSNIEEGLLTAYLTKCGYTPAQISVAIMMAGTPLATAMAEADPAVLQTVIAEVTTGLAAYEDDQGLALPMQAWVVTAKA